PFIESRCRRSRVAPELIRVLLGAKNLLGEFEHPGSDAAAAKVLVDRHSTQLPGGLFLPWAADERRAPDNGAASIHRREMMGCRLIVTWEIGEFPCQPGAKNPPSQIHDFFESGCANKNRGWLSVRVRRRHACQSFVVSTTPSTLQ